jgi:hypothetical protein
VERKEKIYFISFCSQGPPYDSGIDLSDNEDNIRLLLGNFFDGITIYTPTSIKECDGSEGFCEFHDGVFNLNPGLNSNGCGDFKSFIIDKTLNEIEENDILIYHDCNFHKYPQYWQTDWENINEIIEFLLYENRSDFFMPFEHFGFQKDYLLSQHGKRYTTDAIIGNKIESDIVSRCYEIASSRIIVKNTSRSREFFREYKNLCKRKDLLTKYPNPNPYPLFTHSCPEQHVLNCLVYKYILDGKLDKNFPRYAFPDRKLIMNSNVEHRINAELSKYITSKSIKEFEKHLTNDRENKDIRGTKKFREDLFST